MAKKINTENMIKESTITDDRLKIGAIVYYAQALEPVGIFEVLELKIRTIMENWCVGIEKRDKHAYLFFEHEVGEVIFFDRNEALKVVKEAEKKCKKKCSDETYYEEF